MPIGRPSCSIAVVGCGAAGAASAVLLARAGHRVTLFEQSDHIGPVGAGLLLQPSGQRVLARLGLLDRVVATGERIDRLVALSHTGRKISRLCYADHGGCCAYGVHRPDLFSALHDALVHAGVDLRLNAPIAGVDLAADRATLTGPDGAVHGPFDLVVAADGQRSRLRQFLDVPRVEFEYDAAALWGVGRCESTRNLLYQVTRGTRQLVGLLPTGGGRVSLFWGIDRRDVADVRARGLDALIDDVAALCPQARNVLRCIGSVDKLALATYRCVVLRHAFRGRVVFVGDAAHASSPHLGQGVNLALVDAATLADALTASDAAPSSDAIDGALRRYDRSRRWPNAWYSALSAALTPTFQSGVPLLGRARDVALPMLQRVPPLRKLMLRTLTGVTG